MLRSKSVSIYGILKDNIYEELLSVFIKDRTPFDNDYSYTPNKISRPYKTTKNRMIAISTFVIIALNVFILYLSYSIMEKFFITTILTLGSIRMLKLTLIKTQGIDFYNQKQYYEAINIFYQLSSKSPAEAGTLIDYCFNQLNKPEDSINALQNIKPASYRIKTFYQYLMLRQYDSAINYLNEEVKDSELQNRPLAASIIAMTFLYLKNDPAGAIEYIKSKDFIFIYRMSVSEALEQSWLLYNQAKAVSKSKFSDMFFINSMQNSIANDSKNSYEFEINIIKYILSICYEKIGDTINKERIDEEIRASGLSISNIANSKCFIDLRNFFTYFAKANV